MDLLSLTSLANQLLKQRGTQKVAGWLLITLVVGMSVGMAYSKMTSEQPKGIASLIPTVTKRGVASWT